MTTNIEASPAVKVLTRARELLETNGWIQESYSRANGYCLVGAVWAAEEALHLDEVDEYVPLSLLRSAINLPDDEDYCEDESPVIQWNDYEGRTKDEVLAMLDRAIALGLGVQP